MVQLVKITLILVWLFQALRQGLLWSYWLQVKEYRVDRFKEFFFSRRGARELNLPLIGLKLALVLFSNSLFLILIVLLDAYFIFEILSHRARRPIFTQRGRRLVLTALFLSLSPLVLSFIYKVELSSVVGISEIALLVSPFLGILWTIPFVEKAKKRDVARAKEILETIKPIVIGVTGSYGKSTTKEFIAHLLSQKYKVAKTIGSQNTVLGVARCIIDGVRADTEFLVVEMGAYKKGEVRAISEIVRPSIGVVTGIEPQHLSLFGSVENIKAAKFELIETLADNGMAIFNFSNPFCQELAKKARKLSKRLSVLDYYQTKIVSKTINGISFEVYEGKDRKRLYAPVMGEHFVENLGGAILIARKLGVSWEKIKKGCKTLEMPDKTMAVYKLKGGSYIVDDSYNSTPRGFSSALAYLRLFPNSEKVVITPGVIELGSVSGGVHRKLGKEMAMIVDEIILTDSEFERDLAIGLGLKRNKLLVMKDPIVLENKIKGMINKGSVILLEGKVPKIVHDCIDSVPKDE